MIYEQGDYSLYFYMIIKGKISVRKKRYVSKKEHMSKIQTSKFVLNILLRLCISILEVRFKWCK